MKESAQYVRIVEWSEKDGCYVGSCPGLFYGGCHGPNEQEVFAELCEIVEETIKLYKRERKPPHSRNLNLARTAGKAWRCARSRRPPPADQRQRLCKQNARGRMKSARHPGT